MANRDDADGGSDDLASAVRRRVAPLGGVELEPHPPVEIGAPERFERARAGAVSEEGWVSDTGGPVSSFSLVRP